MKPQTIFICLAAMMLAACEERNTTTLPPTVTPPTATEARVTPTPLAAGQAITFDNLQVNFMAHEFTTRYTDQFNTVRDAPTSIKFLWIQIGLKNIATAAHPVPTPEHFSLLYFQTEIKSSAYARRKDFLDYTTLSGKINPNQEIKAWLRFDVPVNAEAPSLWFVYLPQSSRVAFLPPNSPAWGEHPEYLWALR